MLTLVVRLLLAVAFVSWTAAIGRDQAVSVKGRLLCGSKPEAATVSGARRRERRQHKSLAACETFRRRSVEFDDCARQKNTQ